MNEEWLDIWAAMDEVRTVVDAVCGDAVWSLRHNVAAGCLELELNRHLPPDEAEALARQFYLTADYTGEGNRGSLFVLYRQ